MAAGLEPSVVTGAFTLGGVALTYCVTALNENRRFKRENHLRFEQERLDAAATLLACADSTYRLMQAASRLLPGGASRIDDAADGRVADLLEQDAAGGPQFGSALARVRLLFPPEVSHLAAALGQQLALVVDAVRRRQQPQFRALTDAHAEFSKSVAGLFDEKGLR